MPQSASNLPVSAARSPLISTLLSRANSPTHGLKVRCFLIHLCPALFSEVYSTRGTCEKVVKGSFREGLIASKDCIQPLPWTSPLTGEQISAHFAFLGYCSASCHLPIHTIWSPFRYEDVKGWGHARKVVKK